MKYVAREGAAGPRASVESVVVRVRSVSMQSRPGVLLETPRGLVQAVATHEQAALAQTLVDGDERVATLVHSAAGTRLLSLRTADEHAAPVSVPAVAETLDRFDGVLRILAR